MPAPTTVAPAASTSARRARSDVTTVAPGDDELADAVVGRVAAAPRGVAHGDAAVVALGQVVLGHVEHERHRLAEALQPGEQPPHGAGAVAPPAVGTGADHVVAVDDEADGP